MTSFFNEISETQADLIKSFAIFYLLLVGNYIGDSLFTCFQIDFIKNNKFLKLVIAFLLFYFLVTLISTTGKLEYTPPIEKFIRSLFYFIGFLCVMRLDIRLSSFVLILIFIIYFIELNKDYYLDERSEIQNKTDEKIYNENQYWITLNWPIRIRLIPVNKDDFIFINKIETAIYYIITILLVIGFIAYGGEIKDTVKHSNNLTWLDVITNTHICKLKDKKSFWHYFRIGLGLKL